MSIPQDQDTLDMVHLAQGHDAALNELMLRHGERLFHYLLRSLQDESDAADLAQETFVRVYQNRTRFKQSQKFTTWLYAIASNLVRDRYRWRSRHPHVSFDAEPTRDSEASGSLKNTLRAGESSPDVRLEQHERALTVRKAISGLPDELRQPLILSVYEDLPQAEIAKVLSISVKAVETRIYRARQRLKTNLGALVTTI